MRIFALPESRMARASKRFSFLLFPDLEMREKTCIENSEVRISVSLRERERENINE